VIELHHIFTLATVLGAASMWLMLPRGDADGAMRERWLGALLGAVALGLLASRFPGVDNVVAESVFYVLAGVTVAGAAAAVTFRNPIYCALWFGLSLMGSAGLLLFIGAQFLAVATVAVYAGAILVTFMFVLMLAQPEGRAAYDRTSWEALVSVATGSVIVGILSMTVSSVLSAAEEAGTLQVAASEKLPEGVLAEQHTALLGGELFGRHLVAVEVAGVLLTAALVGAAVIVAQVNKREGSE